MEIKLAITPKELDQVFKLRYQVYVEEEGKFGGINFPAKMMSDEFDRKKNTYNLLLLKDGEAIGTVRVTKSMFEEEKLPSDKLFDFNAIKKSHYGLMPASIGMLAVSKLYQNRKTFIALMLALGKQLLKTQRDYYIFTLNHECSKLICRSFGAKIIQEKIWSDEARNFIIPMILYKEQVLSYINNAKAENILEEQQSILMLA